MVQFQDGGHHEENGEAAAGGIWGAWAAVGGGLPLVGVGAALGAV